MSLPPRPPLSASMSFSGSASAGASSRPPLKRRMTTSTSDLDFFTPAATSFNPLPYAPNGTSSQKQHPYPSRSVRNVDTLAPPVMDPVSSDPHAVFIRPPFTNFPGADAHPEGLSYPLMAANPEWFLFSDDFAHVDNPNPKAIPYPPHLEPPRGWCPAKKKDLKERGGEGWPEGEEPRLRCTFCRRTYAGVNAKSMWRRHVFEKHKIAMSNRREGNERPRGRSSNKENNRQPVVSSRENTGATYGKMMKMDIALAEMAEASASRTHRSKFRSVSNKEAKKEKIEDEKPPASPCVSHQEETVHVDPVFARPHPLSQSTLPPVSPPLTPRSPVISQGSDASKESESSQTPTSPPQVLPIVPASPYDPLLTPSFRHSSPRLPSDQPWRFPSPSHPLHSKTRELCLSMLLPSPAVKHPSGTDASPARLLVPNTPLFASPSVYSKQRSGAVGELETPEIMEKLSRPSPRTMFSRGRLPVPVADRMRPEKMRHLVEESPLSLSARQTSTKRFSHLHTPSDDWTSSSALSGSDPFVDDLWAQVTPAKSPLKPRAPFLATPGGESPVLRKIVNSSSSSGQVGLGIGLLAPFALPRDRGRDESDDDDDDDDDLDDEELEREIDGGPGKRWDGGRGRERERERSSSTGDETEVESSLVSSVDGSVDRTVRPNVRPPLKKRKTVESCL